MNDTPFALATLVVAVSGLVVLASSRFGSRLGIPLPAVVLAGAVLAAEAVPSLHPAQSTVQRIVGLALVAVLFDGGMHLGWARFRPSLWPVGVVGVGGTFLTAALGALAVHVLVGGGWYAAVLVATALAPTDPTVVFSVLGRREIAGRSGTILEGESGANDPVGIALMAGLIGAQRIDLSGAGHVAVTFAGQMAVGLAVGLVGGRLLALLMTRLPLPDEGLYPLRTLGAAYALFAAGTLAHGSGFLAVFVAGMVVGDLEAPFKAEVARFHGALGSLGEIVAFVVLGLTVHVSTLARPAVWGPGLLVGVLFAAVVRPLALAPLLAATRLRANERLFVLFAGLKGAVPILLAGQLYEARLPGVDRLYGIVVVAVTFSVVAQGGAVGAVARLLRLPMSVVAPMPWSVGVRLADAPPDVVRTTIAPGSSADGRTVADVEARLPDASISLLVRDGRLQPVQAGTRLRAGDDVTVVGGPAAAVTDAFDPPAS